MEERFLERVWLLQRLRENSQSGSGRPGARPPCRKYSRTIHEGRNHDLTWQSATSFYWRMNRTRSRAGGGRSRASSKLRRVADCSVLGK